MIAMLTTLVFAAAGYFGGAIVIVSVRDAAPSLRRLSAERRSLAADQVYLFTMIETPRHEGATTTTTIAEPARTRIASPASAKIRFRRQGRVAMPAATLAKYPAAA